MLRDGDVVSLAPKALDLLVALVENSGHVLSKDDLMKQVWSDSFVEEANLSHQVIADLTLQAKRLFISPIDLARIYAALGDKEQAFDWLTKTYEERVGWLVHLKVDPVFDSLRSDPRFSALLRRLNFPQ